jgi:hypothetical protein
MIVAAFAGTGKTYFASQHPDIAVDLVLTPYKYIIDPEMTYDEATKADHNSEMNPEYPINYVEAIRKCSSDKIILIPSDSRVLRRLEKEKIPYYLCYPKRRAKKEYEKRYIKRGNPKIFLTIFIDGWKSFMDTLREDTYGKHIILKPKQYLSDVLDIKEILKKKTKEVIMSDNFWWDTNNDDSCVNSILKLSVETRKWYLKTDVKLMLKRFIKHDVDFEELIQLWKRLQIVKKDFGEKSGSMIIQQALKELNNKFNDPELLETINLKITIVREGLNNAFEELIKEDL